MDDEGPRVTELSAVLRELHFASGALLRTLDDPRRITGEDGYDVIREQRRRLRKAVAAAEPQMTFGVIYGLYDEFSGAIRYVGQTVDPLAVRVRSHRRAHTLVGDRFATGRLLKIAPLEDPHLVYDGEHMERVVASQLDRLERCEIYRYTWAGAALLNRSTARDEVRAWQWRLDNGPYLDWGSIQEWRDAVRTVPCYECPSLANEPCVERHGAATRGGANHLGRIAADVRRRWCADRAQHIIGVVEDLINDHEYSYLFQAGEGGSMGERLKELHTAAEFMEDFLERQVHQHEEAQLLMREFTSIEQHHGVREVRAARPASDTWRSARPRHSRPGLESLVRDMHCAYAEISGIPIGPTTHQDYGFLF